MRHSSPKDVERGADIPPESVKSALTGSGESPFPMKTSKRKRSTTAAKAEPGVETPSVAAVVAAEINSEASEPAAAMAAAADAEPATTAASDPIVVLAANCSVKDAAALKISLCAVAKESAAVTLDIRTVERIDTSTMQLLCAFVRDRLGRNQRVTWQGESQALRDAARLLGVRALLGFEDANGVAA
jgi:ABC-type transporter Mla MlaB component